MAQILAFPDNPTPRPPVSREASGDGVLIIFPGVRYEPIKNGAMARAERSSDSSAL